MTTLGLIGILMGLCAFPFFSQKRTATSVTMFAAVYIGHIASTFAYYSFVQLNDADSFGYYYDPFGFYFARGFGISTQFIIWTVQSMKRTIGGTYLDYFLFFQSFGFFGLVFMYRTIEDIFERMGVTRPVWVLILMFMPGAYFWSSAIGKDAPLFLASAMAVFAAMRLKERWWLFGLAILIMFMIRAHIAFIAIIAMALAIVFDSRLKLSSRAAILVVIGIGGFFVARTLQEMLKIDLTDARSLGDFFSSQQEVAADVFGETSLTYAPYYTRLISLMFRPFFFDAEGIFGLIASFENVLFVGLIGLFVIRGGTLFRVIMAAPFVRYSLIFAITLLLLLAELYYNVGLGLRQRTMALPPLVAALCAVIAGDLQLRAAARARRPTAASMAPRGAALPDVRRSPGG